MARDNVLLVGFMGAGKSVCGRLLARRLGRCFVETDDIIVSRDGRSIPDIFRQDGEEAFRRLEGEVLDALAIVVEHRAGELDLMVRLEIGRLPGELRVARSMRLVERVGGEAREGAPERGGLALRGSRRLGGRPMLERPPAEIEAVYRAREPYYARAHLTVDTAGLGVDQVVARMLAALRQTHAARV